jgi:hypothetical protein
MIVNTQQLSYLKYDAPVKLCINMELTTLHFYIFSRLRIFSQNWLSPKWRKTWEKLPQDKVVWIDV